MKEATQFLCRRFCHRKEDGKAKDLAGDFATEFHGIKQPLIKQNILQ